MSSRIKAAAAAAGRALSTSPEPPREPPAPATPQHPFSVYRAIQEYISKIVKFVPGMKSLLLDSESSKIVSMVYGQSDLTTNDVLLFENIDVALKDDDEEAHQKLHHLKACVFARPTRSTLSNLSKFVKSPRYKEYYIFFTNICEVGYLDSLAEADEFEYIKHVSEFYGDYLAVTAHLFHPDYTLRNIATKYSFQNSTDSAHHSFQEKQAELYHRDYQVLMSVILSMKKRPDIRYLSYSEKCKKLAMELTHNIKVQGDLFTFPGMPISKENDTLLLILDRREDPVTPLLTQWTYQAMIHELLGISYNRIDMHHVKKFDNDIKEVVLSSEQDKFFKSSMFLNYGELGMRVNDLLKKFQESHKTQSKLDSIEDMQRFIDNYPKFKAEQGTVSKHVAVAGELLRQVKERQLMRVSSLEQELACGPPDHDEYERQLLEIIQDPHILWYDKLRLGILYAIRFESHSENQIKLIIQKLREKALSERDRSKCVIIEEMLRYAGNRVRKSELFSDTTLKGMFKNVMTSIKGVENVYTQHKPLLVDILEQIIKNDLKTVNYPYLEAPAIPKTAKNPYRYMIVYFVGGTTYEEAASVEELMKKFPNVKIVLGGSTIHNSRSFMNELLPEDMDVVIQVSESEQQQTPSTSAASIPSTASLAPLRPPLPASSSASSLGAASRQLAPEASFQMTRQPLPPRRQHTG